MKRRWKDSVRDAIRRQCDRNGSDFFTLQELKRMDLDQIIRETQAHRAKTPDRTLERVLQQLRDLGEIEFVDNRGRYRRL